MSIAYLLNNPSIVLGKKSKGQVNNVIFVVNLPWILLAWLIFKLQILFSRENFADNIKETNIWLSRRPTPADDLTKFDLVVDLTCEFLRDKNAMEYICYPNLDGHNLRNFPSKLDISKDKVVLIHCANGHGRTALFASILLNRMEITQNMEEALSTVRQNRKLAIPNTSQQKWLLNTNVIEKS